MELRTEKWMYLGGSWPMRRGGGGGGKERKGSPVLVRINLKHGLGRSREKVNWHLVQNPG